MVSVDEIKRIAALAKLHLTEEETALLAEQMSSIVAFADEINNSKLPVSEEVLINEYDRTEFREDEVVPSSDVSDILNNSGGTQGNFFMAKDKVKAGRRYG
jgi:aspartyl-tRNA(Asn)/glutamyl-tRNA(Gln) amidotransferase subunit C